MEVNTKLAARAKKRLVDHNKIATANVEELEQRKADLGRYRHLQGVLAKYGGTKLGEDDEWFMAFKKVEDKRLAEAKALNELVQEGDDQAYELLAKSNKANGLLSKAQKELKEAMVPVEVISTHLAGHCREIDERAPDELDLELLKCMKHYQVKIRINKSLI